MVAGLKTTIKNDTTLLMTPDPKLKKKIDIIYRATKLVPILTIVLFCVPYITIILALLGLVFWFKRRNLLKAADSGASGLDSVTPPLASAKQSGQISTAAQLDFIRRHKHFLLIPLYLCLLYPLYYVLLICAF
jgi:hypothetical protein